MLVPHRHLLSSKYGMETFQYDIKWSTATITISTTATTNHTCVEPTWIKVASLSNGWSWLHKVGPTLHWCRQITVGINDIRPSLDHHIKILFYSLRIIPSGIQTLFQYWKFLENSLNVSNTTIYNIAIANVMRRGETRQRIWHLSWIYLMINKMFTFANLCLVPLIVWLNFPFLYTRN